MSGQKRKGTDLGPRVVLDAGLTERMDRLGWKVEGPELLKTELEGIEGDEHHNIRNPRGVGASCRVIAETVEDAVSKKRLALTLGGDHSIAMGTVSGVARVYPNVAVLWIDAHADINTGSSSPSGSMHGMPVAFLLGLNDTQVGVPGWDWFHPCLKTHSLCYIGLRDLDPFEREMVRSGKVKAFGMHEVDKYGIAKVLEMALDHLCLHRDRQLHVSFDVDVLDPTVAPATGTPVRGGLTFREGHYLCEELALSGQLVSADLVEVNPLLTTAFTPADTAALGCGLACSLLGETLL